MSEAQFLEWAKRTFRCSSARISKFPGSVFLIIGKQRSTRMDAREGRGVWYRNGEPNHFLYIAERVIASGPTLNAVLESAKQYKRLQRMSMMQYVKEVIL